MAGKISENMISVHRIDDPKSREASEFIELPFDIYRENPHWVPHFRREIRNILRREHAFFEHSDGEFYLVRRGNEPAGRIVLLENKNFNRYREKRDARFYLFECRDDEEAATALFDAFTESAVKRGLNRLIGPQGFSAMTGGGILIDGFEYTSAMTMMNYHLPYYRRLVEAQGFEKFKDFYSGWITPETYRGDEKIGRVAEIARKRGGFEVLNLKTKRDLVALAREIGETYNEAWTDHEEYCPLTDREIDSLADDLVLVTNPELIKVIRREGKLAGFLLTFPDLSPQLQASRGRLTPLTLIRIWWAKMRTRYFIVNGLGMLPEYRNMGGTAILYAEGVKTLLENDAAGADMTQIAETTDLMMRDMATLGGDPYKTHRVYQKRID